MNLANKYLSKEEYESEWEPKYQALEKKYFGEGGSDTADTPEYNADVEKLDYYYAKTVSQRMQKKMAEVLTNGKSALERNDYKEFELQMENLQTVWKDFNSPFHYKMNARGILERD